MADGSTVKVVYLGDADHLNKATKRAVADLDRVGKKASGVGSKLAGVGKSAALGVAGVAAVAVGGLTAALIGGVKDAMSYQKVIAVTGAAIKSTGGVANVTSKSVQALAGNLESLSGVDEELILNAQNVLLTFTKVRNEVGKGNDVFTQGTKAALNMSIALGQDLQSSTILVGKALNDPIKGITAMSRAGVAFTEQQKKQIRTLAESGRTLDAQKIILAELETQFGGVAKAAGSGLTGSIARAKDAFSDLFRNIATPLLPKIAEWAEKFAKKVNDDVAPAIMRFIDQFERGVGPGGEFRDQLKSLGESARDAWPHIKTVFEKTKAVVDFVIEHKDAFATITAGVVAYALAMKAAAVWTGAMAAIKLGATALGIGAVGAASAAAAPGVAALSGAILGPAGLVAALTALALAPSMWAASRVTDGGGSAEFAPYDPRATGGTGRPGYKPPIPKGLTPNGGRTDGPKRKPGEGNMPSWRPSGPPQDDVNGRPRGGRLATGGQTINLVVDGKTLATVVNRQNGKGDRNGGF